jgi:peptidoglycan/LPS O-acetylase OafA/YrhL
VTRLEPPYVINMLLLAALWLAMPGANALELLRRLAASLTYTHNLAYGTGSFINPVAWSLEIEVQLYLTAPLLAAVFALRRRALRRGVLFLALAASAVLSEWGRSKAFTAGVPSLPFYLQYFQYFLTGFLVADFYLTEWQESPRRGFAWDLVGLAAWAGIGAGLIKVSTSRYLLTPLVLLALVAAFRGRVTSALLRLPGIVTVGGMCYTIYLYHFQVLTGLHGFVGALVPDGASFAARFFIELGVLTPPLLALSALLFAFLERPFMRRGWYRRGGGPLRAPGPGR